VSRFFDRHFVVLALAVLCLAAFNLAFRLGSEFVSEWDESLYAISAWEAVDKGSWIGTTFFGELDYYNTKPPLMVWLVALAFKAFGRSLTSLRLVPAISAWLTVAALQYWTKRWFGPIVALIASLVLTTTFGFIYVHSGRSAVTDAPFTLVILLIVATLWAEKERPGLRAWLGRYLVAIGHFQGMAMWPIFPMSILPFGMVGIAGIAICIISPGLPWKIIFSQASPSIFSIAKADGTVSRVIVAAAIAVGSSRMLDTPRG